MGITLYQVYLGLRFHICTPAVGGRPKESFQSPAWIQFESWDLHVQKAYTTEHQLLRGQQWVKAVALIISEASGWLSWKQDAGMVALWPNPAGLFLCFHIFYLLARTPNFKMTAIVRRTSWELSTQNPRSLTRNKEPWCSSTSNIYVRGQHLLAKSNAMSTESVCSTRSLTYSTVRRGKDLPSFSSSSNISDRTGPDLPCGIHHWKPQTLWDTCPSRHVPLAMTSL